jgi:TRAP transporter TAXI family solute receptor
MDRRTEHLTGRRRALLVIVGVVALAAALWLATSLWRPLPPRSFVLAGGPAGSAYMTYAQEYRAILARDGIRVDPLETAGSTANLDLLLDPASGVKAAFVLGGVVPKEAAGELVSLGTVSYEPMWLFCRCAEGSTLGALKGLRLSVGTPGSGGHEIAYRLIEMNGLRPGDFQLSELPPAEAASHLEAGDLDAAFIIAGWDEPVVRRLTRAPDVRLLGFPRADAYVALYPFLDKLVLPMGVADLAANRPPVDIALVAPRATLVVRRDLHPALQLLLINAAEEVHSRPGIFQAAGAFPAADAIDLPISDAARQFYLNGPSFLQRNMPFWFGQILQRLLLVLAPLLGILYPLSAGLPRLYRWQMQHRIYRLYGELKWIERELHDAPAGSRRDELVEQLAELEDRLLKMRLPNAYAAMGYMLKLHVKNLREAHARRPVAPTP